MAFIERSGCLLRKWINCRIGVISEMLENEKDGEDQCYNYKASCCDEGWLMKPLVCVCIGWARIWCHYLHIFHSQLSITWIEALCYDLPPMVMQPEIYYNIRWESKYLERKNIHSTIRDGNLNAMLEKNVKNAWHCSTMIGTYIFFITFQVL